MATDILDQVGAYDEPTNQDILTKLGAYDESTPPVQPSPNMSPSLWQGLKQNLGQFRHPLDALNAMGNSPVTQNITNVAGGAAQGLVNAGTDVANLPWNVVGAQGPVPQVNLAGVNPNSLYTKIPEAITQYGVPGMGAAKAAEGAGVLAASPTLRNALAGFVSGTAASPGDIGERSATGAINAAIPMATRLGSAVGGIGSDIKNFLTGKSVQDAADNLYQDVAAGKPTDVLNKENIQNIKQNYLTNRDSISQGYEDLMDEAERKGFTNDADTRYKGILPSDDTTDSLNSILNPVDENQNLANVSGKLKTTINNYQNNPSFSNAHDLQSQLGNEASRFYRFGDPLSSNTAQFLSDARANMIDDIHQGFVDGGNPELGDQYQALSDQWRDQVSPYKNVPQIWNTIGPKAKAYPKNILNVLSNDDERGNIATIRNQLAQDPQQSQNVIAQQLSSANDASGADAKELVNNALNMPTNLKQFMTPDLTSRVNQLNDLQQRYENFGPKFKNLKNYGAVASALAIPAGVLAYLWPHGEKENLANSGANYYDSQS